MRHQDATGGGVAERLKAAVLKTAEDLAARARRIQAQAIVVDTHVDAPDVPLEKRADIG